MMPIDETLWPAQQPPLGFAEATVERLLANCPVMTPTHHRRSLWQGFALAAVFVSGAAYGWVLHSNATRTAAVRGAPPLNSTPAPTMHSRVPLVALPSALELATPKSPAPALRTLSPTTPTSNASSAPAVQKAPPKVPACQCERGFSDVICDCY